MDISIKMDKSSLVLKLDPERTYSEQKEDIKEYLDKMKNFLKNGAMQVKYNGADLSFFEEIELCEMMDAAFGEDVSFCHQKHPPERLMRHILSSGEMLSRTVHGTVRGGDVIISNGDLIVLGDVNQAAELRAAGNIYVLGALRGTASAGEEGNKDAVIFALKMAAGQLKIAGAAAFDPHGVLNEEPAFAKCENGEILVKKF